MKILIVTKTKSGGGTEKHVAEVAGALKGQLAIDIAYTEDGFWRLYNRIYHNRYDVLHFFLPRPYVLGTLAADLALFTGVRIMSRRSLTDNYQKWWIRWLEKLCHRRTHIMVGNSEAVVNQLAREVPAHKIRLIRNGVTIKPLPRELTPTFFIVCVANNFAYKGLNDLITAVRQVEAILPEPWHCILIGRDTETIKGWRIDGLGWRNDVRSWLGVASIFVLPSHEEGCSNALLEAMACGVPVIATDVGGNRSAIEHGISGLLVPPRNPDKLADAIRELALSSELREKLAAQAKIVVNARFSFQRCLDEYQTLYRSAVKESDAIYQPVPD